MRQPFIVAVFISAASVAAVSQSPATVDGPPTGFVIWPSAEVEAIANRLEREIGDRAMVYETVRNDDGHSVYFVLRGLTGRAEFHETEADLYVVHRGSATFVIGGELIDAELLPRKQQRGSAMQAAAQQADSTMVSLLGLSTDDVQQLVDSCREDGEVLQIANYLCPGNIVVSGSRTACERIQVTAVEAGAMKAIPLAVAGAFHTEVMQAAVEPLRQVLENVALNVPRIPVISNVDASVHSDPEIIRQHLVQQVVSPVRWEECMGTLLNQGIDQFYEIGPGRVLRGLLRRIARKTPCENVSC